MQRIRPFHILVLLIPLFLASIASAGSSEKLFAEGNAAYSVGDYDKAIAAYENIIQEEGYAASVLYNLGNSYAQKGMIGKAVLCYERALKLDPSNSDIIGNLEKLRKDAGLFIPEKYKIELFFDLFSIYGWALATLLAVVAVTILLACRLKLNISKKMFGWSCGLAVVLLTVSVAGIKLNYGDYNPLIILQKDVKLQVSPFDGSSPVGAIAEGKMVLPLGRDYGEYLYVEDVSGRRGWLHSGAAEPVCN